MKHFKRSYTRTYITHVIINSTHTVCERLLGVVEQEGVAHFLTGGGPGSRHLRARHRVEGARHVQLLAAAQRQRFLITMAQS